jgi:integrase
MKTIAINSIKSGTGKSGRRKTEIWNHYFEYLYLRSGTMPDKPKGIDTGERKIDFHSFRHIYAARMADRMAADKVAKVTGHRSKTAAKIYQDHVTARILKEAGAEAAAEFGNILEFTRKEA